VFQVEPLLLPLLAQIQHALNQLLTNQVETLIDLQNLPLEPPSLLNFLGQGEVKAELTTLGKSLVWETAFPGVWVVEHYNPEEILLSRTLEITWIPAILKSPPEDVQTGLTNLQRHLSEL